MIEDLIAGKPIKLRATSYGTDCYPRTEIETYVTKDMLNQAYMFNPKRTRTTGGSEYFVKDHLHVLGDAVAQARQRGLLQCRTAQPFYSMILL